MGSPYTPVPGTFRVLETISLRQLPLPITQREIKAGDALWNNVDTSNQNPPSWVEPALNSPSGYSGSLVAGGAAAATGASTSTTLVAEQEAFAALFMGIALAHRTPRSFAKYLNYATQYNGTAQSAIYYDSSAPFITVCTAGIADVPYYDGTYSAVQSGNYYAVGQGVAMSGFDNASTYFIDASGVLQNTASKYWLYNNSVMFSSTVGGTGSINAAAIIGRLVKPAKPGDTIVRIEFSSYLSIPVSGQVAGAMLI